MYSTSEIHFDVSELGDRTATFDIDSNLLPHISVDTYQVFAGDWVAEIELEHMAEHHDIDADKLEISWGDQSDVLRKLSEAAVDTLNSQLYDGTVTFMGVNSTYSPTYYNFKTDSFNTTMTVNLNQLASWIYEEHGSVIQAIEDYGNENFHSYDGFMSFVIGAMHDERRLGTLIWLGVHMYLSEHLDRDTCFSGVAEAEHEAYFDSFKIVATRHDWRGIAEDIVCNWCNTEQTEENIDDECELGN